MKLFNNSLNCNLNTNVNENHIGLQHKPLIYNKPITSNSAPITLNAMSDVEGLQRAYARDNGMYVRTTTMVVAGTKDFPQEAWDDVKHTISNNI